MAFWASLGHFRVKEVFSRNRLRLTNPGAPLVQYFQCYISDPLPGGGGSVSEQSVEAEPKTCREKSKGKKIYGARGANVFLGLRPDPGVAKVCLLFGVTWVELVLKRSDPRTPV